ncbi:KGGVGR-motif variant AAA ATPase [Cellulosimicrobium cellulans]|uniref:KGGVGR-motif variant AAA ATPase n=1 Tax=Cellulosimicrobium cellulans TaxID=1710 RepID=UPI002097163C|nr:P-loop NTPase [Cellulosimicrobium cellulans]MCO7272250.1 P-loop NTPase [Cellulosimicrobium cellulans]
MRFDHAASNAITIAESFATTANRDVIVVRDLLGRNALALDGGERNVDDLRQTLRDECSPFVGADPVIFLEDLLAPELLRDSTNRRPAPFLLSPSGRVSVIERGTVGADWLNPNDSPPARRVTLYGFKGGVGRSTATFSLARHLAQQGLVVLVVDLDLESPGVSTMLAPEMSQLPEHGILDHLVEYGVGNEHGLDLAARSSAIGDTVGNGEVWISAAAGRPTPGSSYLDKLSRAYLDLPAAPESGRGRIPFGARLSAAVAACEAQVERESRRPDITLLDSRSGIHDIAAVAITQLSALSLLFATDNPQTWQGYGELFGRWATRLDSNSRSALRDRLQMVAALVPQGDPASYLRRFADNAQACFASTLYDETPANAEISTFNFAPQDESAPHFPIPIHHSVDLIGIVPGVDSRWSTAGTANFAYADFLDRATRLILEAQDA